MMLPMFWNDAAERRADEMCRMYHRDAFTFAWLYDHLAKRPDRAQIRAIAHEAMAYLPDADGRVVSSCYDAWSKVRPERWKKYCTDEEFRALLLIGTMHVNGYFREICVELLQKDTMALPYLLRRVTDWVPCIRWKAQDAVMELIETVPLESLMKAMPHVEALRRSERCRGEIDFPILYAKLLSRFAENPAHVLCHAGRVRRLCYEVLFHAAPSQNLTGMPLRLLRFWMTCEKDGAQRNWLVTQYLCHSGEGITEAELSAFRQDRSWRIRYQAYLYQWEHSGRWEGFENLLLDGAASVREFAAYYLEKEGFDCAGFCRDHLPEGIPALAEWGTKADIPLIRQYLTVQPCTCLYALAHLGAEDADTLLWDFLHSDNAAAACTAFRIIWSRRIRYPEEELLSELNASSDPKLRWRLIKLLGLTSVWRAMPVLIRLVREYSHLRTDILHVIDQRSKWQPLAPELAAQITEAISYAESSLPEETVRKLRFEVRCLKKLNK